MVYARDERFDAAKAWNLLHKAKTITTAKGKKVQKWDPEADDKAAILQQVLGPSGNLRAPTYRIKDTFVVGFNPDFYSKWVAKK